MHVGKNVFKMKTKVLYTITQFQWCTRTKCDTICQDDNASVQT